MNSFLGEYLMNNAVKSKPESTITAKSRRVSGRRAARGEKSATAFRTISEVANEIGVQQHVLRFWESKFTQIKPMKRGGGRRYYRPEDVTLIQSIHNLLYNEGYTIKGVQKLLSTTRGKIEKVEVIVNPTEEKSEAVTATHENAAITNEQVEAMAKEMADKMVLSVKSKYKQQMKTMLDELKQIKSLMAQS